MIPAVELVSDLKNEKDFDADWYQLSDNDHFWIRWRFLALLGFLKKLKLSTTAPLRTIDVGAGNGIWREQIESATAWNVDCVDLNPRALEGIKSGRGRCMYYNILDEKPELLGQYDIAFILDVIEHLPAPVPFLHSVSKHVKKSGIVIINVPALQSMHGRYDEFIGHLRRYNKKTLSKSAELAGLKILDVRYWGWSLIPVLMMRKLLLKSRNSNENIVKRGYKAPSELVNRLFKRFAQIETCLFSRPPIGTSLLLAAQKT